MPTPPVNSASTISHLTAGTRQPYSIEAAAILPHLGERPAALLGREADVVHQPERDDEHHDQDDAAQHERHAEARLLRR